MKSEVAYCFEIQLGYHMIREIKTGRSVTVIGGGPAGMTAAILAARQGAKTVRLVEKNSILGRKLLATGNGRCNLTNLNCSDAEETLLFFFGLGLITRSEGEGRVYPYTEQASAVQDALIGELNGLNVEILCGQEVRSIESRDSGYWIDTNQGGLYSDAVILATGGKAGPQYGSTGDGYRFAKAFGHHVARVMPSLVQMVSDQTFFKALKGVRTKGSAELLRGNEVIDREAGEIQFTEDGLSGICIFNLSREYVSGDRIRIDLFPEYSAEVLEKLLTERISSLKSRDLLQFFNGMLHKKLIPVIVELLSLKAKRNVSELTREDIAAVVDLLKGWEIPVTGTKGWKEAQVTAGGIELSEIDMNTMESKLEPNLYFAGEILNVDGKCGGYNLQWAWTSGMAAGKAAAGKSATSGLERNHAENP